MAISQRSAKLIDSIKKLDLTEYKNLELLFETGRTIEKNDGDRQYAMTVALAVRNRAERLAHKDIRFYDLYNRCLLYRAYDFLDDYLLYIEKDREPKERFYLPRRRTLKIIVDKLQLLADDELDELFIHMPGRVGKTQVVTEFLCWYASKFSEKSNLYCSYADSVAGAFYDGCLELMTDPTYLHHNVFPEAKIVSTDAKGNMLDIGRKKKYKSITSKGLTSGLNGLCDCNGIEIGDDLLEGIQDAMNPDILRRKQGIVDNNYIPRAKTSAKRLWMGTIWSLQDPYSNRVEFLTNDEKAKYIRWDIIKIPALDENDESNFDYDYNVGFSTAHYKQIRAKFERNEDIASWLAQYQQEPIERAGALFTPEFMRFYNGELPPGEPDNIVAACDVAFGGADFLAFGVLYIYGDEGYLVDCVFDNNEKNITQPRLVKMILKHQVKRSFWEYNNGGEGFKDDVERLLKEKGYRHNMIGSFAPTTKRKGDRILDKAPEIREIFYLEDSKRDKDYSKLMNNVYSYKIQGKNAHEDAPDMLAYLCEYSKTTVKIARIMKSPF